MDRAWFACQSCGERHRLAELYCCPDCDGEISVEYDFDWIRTNTNFMDRWHQNQPFWSRFSDILPQDDLESIVTLGEGNTPLVKSRRFAERFGIENLYFKLESTNPTGSFKDRQMTVAISKANEWGKTNFGTASSGNVGVALSAYSARAGFKANVWVSEGTAASKIQQIQVYGAQVYLLPNPEEGSVKDYFVTYLGMQDFCIEHGMVPMISARPVNPYMVEGSKTISYEVVASLGKVPDALFGPVGGGGMLGGVWKGFKELRALGITDNMPHLWGSQRGDYFAPIDKLKDPAHDWSESYRPLDGEWAWDSIMESNGELRFITKQDILDAQAELAVLEGIFAEPQGAYATAGLIKAATEGALAHDACIVCVVTGMGLKDMAAATIISETYPNRKPLVRVPSLRDTSLD